MSDDAQESLFQAGHFNGPDYEPENDQARLAAQISRIFAVMRDGKWRTLNEIAVITKDPEASISAQLRHLRKARFGSHFVDKRRRGDRKNGLYEYRLVLEAENVNTKLTSKNDSHMTPAEIVEAARETLGWIDLDPATTLEANQLVAAKAIFTEDDDGLEQQWSGRVFLNPPGGGFRKARTIEDPGRYGHTKSRQCLWWLKLMIEVERARVDGAIFVGFSIEFLQAAQSLKCLLPTDAPMCVPSSRIRFDTWDDEGNRVSQKQPTHANVIVLVPSAEDEEMVERFQKAFAPIGEVFNVNG